VYCQTGFVTSKEGEGVSFEDSQYGTGTSNIARQFLDNTDY